MRHRELHEENRRSWNAATKAHNSHKVDQAGFFRRGGSTLFPEELALLGDLEGKSLLHLLCNSGQDTLSLAQRGARVTGVDISDEAITFAEGLSRDSGIAARFERDDVFDFLPREVESGTRYDIVYCSYGALCWVSDIERFFTGVAACLAPGGAFVAMEFHPYAMVFDEEWKARYPYLQKDPLTWDDGVTDYVGRAEGALSPSGHVDGEQGFENPHPVHEFLWSVGELVTACANAGLRVERLEEYPYSNGCDFIGAMSSDEQKRYRPPAEVPGLALMYGLVARR